MAMTTPTSSRLKVLIVDDDAATAAAVAAAVPRDRCEVIACPEMALAEVAMETTRFDWVLVAPGCTGVDGAEGLAVTDFVAARSPGALTALLLSEQDRDLAAANARSRRSPVLTTPLLPEAFRTLLERTKGASLHHLPNAIGRREAAEVASVDNP